MCVFFSGEEPESLRGPQAELAVVDELARMRYQQQVFDNAMLGLRLGDKPRLLVSTTPRPTPFMKKLVGTCRRSFCARSANCMKARALVARNCRAQ